MPGSVPLRSSHLQAQVSEDALQRSLLDVLRRVAGHARNFRAEDDARVARFFDEPATLFPQPSPQFTRRHCPMVTRCGYRVKGCWMGWNFAVEQPLPGTYSAKAIPKPISRAILNIVGATAMSSNARPRLIAIVRSSADCRPGLRPATISPRSAYGSGVCWK